MILLLQILICLAFVVFFGRSVIRLTRKTVAQTIRLVERRSLFQFDLGTGALVMFVSAVIVGVVVWLVKDRQVPLFRTLAVFFFAAATGIASVRLMKVIGCGRRSAPADRDTDPAPKE